MMQARCEAYWSLGSFTFDDIEYLEARQPLCEYSRLLLQETDPAARLSCINLVSAALAHEHATRRRC